MLQKKTLFFTLYVVITVGVLFFLSRLKVSQLLLWSLVLPYCFLAAKLFTSLFHSERCHPAWLYSYLIASASFSFIGFYAQGTQWFYLGFLLQASAIALLYSLYKNNEDIQKLLNNRYEGSEISTLIFDDQEVPCKILNISATGCCLICDSKNLKIGKKYAMQLNFGETYLDAEAQLLRIDKTGQCGFKFTKLSHMSEKSLEKTLQSFIKKAGLKEI